MKNTGPSKSPLKGDFLPQAGSPPLRGSGERVGYFIIFHFSLFIFHFLFLFLLLLHLEVITHFVHSFFEGTDALTHSVHEFRNLLATKQKQHYEYDNKQFGGAETTDK